MFDKIVQTAVNAIQDKKGEDIQIIDIKEISVLADYFVIASGSNRSQIQAISDNIEEKMHLDGYEVKQVEGYPSANWILLDYGDIVIHIFDHESREYYNLERIWRDGKFSDVNQL